jgi:hypothetical protein
MFMGYVSLAQWRAGAIGKSRSKGIGGAVSSRRRRVAGGGDASREAFNKGAPRRVPHAQLKLR